MMTQRKAMQTEIVLVRHGAIEGAGNYIYYGETDYSLSVLGREQAKEAGKRLIGESFDAIYVSPLSRAKETAKIICEEAKLDFGSTIYDARLKEMNFGVFEGYSYDRLVAEQPEFAKKMETDWFNCLFEGGESPLLFVQRVSEFFDELVKSEHKRVLVVAHGGAIRAAGSALLACEPDFFWRLKSDHCRISRIEVVDGFGMIRCWNA